MTTAKLDLTPDELIENFEFLGDWEQRFTYLIDLGRKLPEFPREQMVEKNLVPGCQAQVWMIHAVQPDSPSTIRLAAVSDAHLVNGLIAILLSLYDGKPAEEILKIDAEGLFVKLDLEEHLSPTRRNGLHSMVKRIRQIAADAAKRN